MAAQALSTRKVGGSTPLSGSEIRLTYCFKRNSKKPARSGVNGYVTDQDSGETHSNAGRTRA